MGREWEITESTDHPRERKARKQVHSPAKISGFNLLPGLVFFFSHLLSSLFSFGKQQTIAPYLHTLQAITFSCYLLSRMRSVHLFHLFYNSQIRSFLLPISVMFLGFSCLSWEGVIRYSDTDCGLIRTSVLFFTLFLSEQWLFYFDFLICARLWAEVFR